MKSICKFAAVIVAVILAIILTGCGENWRAPPTDEDGLHTVTKCIEGEEFVIVWFYGYPASVQMQPLNRTCDMGKDTD